MASASAPFFAEPNAPSAKDRKALSGVEKRPARYAEALLLFPRVLFWPLRAVLWLVAQPTLLTTRWLERSGIGAAIEQVVDAPEGWVTPRVRWRSRRRVTVGGVTGVTNLIPPRFGAVQNSVFAAGGWSGLETDDTWGGFFRLRVGFGGGLAVTVNGSVAVRDDEWLRMADGQAVRFYQKRARTEVALQWRVWRYLALGSRFAVEQMRWQAVAEKRRFENIAGLDDCPVDSLPWPQRKIWGLRATVGLSFGLHTRSRDQQPGGQMGADRLPAPWRTEHFYARRRIGPAGRLIAELFEPQGGGKARLGIVQAEVWWTWALQKHRGLLTGWLFFAYQKTLDSQPAATIPPPQLFRLGGVQRLRGMRLGEETGPAVGLASLEYRYPLLDSLWFTAFWDWGQATDSSFSDWRWEIKQSAWGGRLEWTPLARWNLYVQVGGSQKGWLSAVGIGSDT